ncbi:MAG: DUF4199 domain-containing protein [Aureispira sp.]|nr:DUF4199 domain-containing protein [Aureispira sp.]
MTRSTRLGLMAGFLAMMFISILYVMDPTLLVDGYERLTLLLFVLTIIYAIQEERKTSLTVRKIGDLQQTTDVTEKIDDSKDFASFGELLQIGFKTYVIAYFIKFFFVYFLFNYYDPSLIGLVRDASVEVYKSFQDFSSDTQEIIEQKIAKYKEGEFGPSLRDPIGIVIELLIGFFVAFMTALFFKRDRPEY